MRAGGIQRETVAGSLVLAAAAFLVAGLTGHSVLGLGFGSGLALGSLNSFMIQAMLDRGTPVLATSFLRLAMFSLLALIAARLLGGLVWPVVMGMGAAQLVMVGIGVRRGWRA